MMLSLEGDRPLDLVTLGRACIDLNAYDYNQPLERTKTFVKYVGGSPANIAIGARRLGLRTGMIAKVSDDAMGRFVVNFLKEVGVDTSGIVVDHDGHKTGLAFTEIKSPTECSILLYRDEVADLYLSPGEIHEDYLRKSKILLISGTALSRSPSREAAFYAAEVARKHGTRIVFELDYRAYTWKSKYEPMVYYTLMARLADVVIGTRDEYDVMEGGRGQDEVTASQLLAYAPSIVVIKHGVDGSVAYTKDAVVRAQAFHAKVLKTFGAGDAYASGLLYGLISGATLERALALASAAAAIVVGRHSSSEAMPSLEEVESFMNESRER
ncbi:5-dehydro-2-deoxygluconokinase [Alicyclobacillus sendaiensis]|uniref:5-dehydro-2-deoxygluconokinase n=1 Tax=Alicyclobacillus sendaiensis PA2 TaxID=3029425 RepID=A0ABT6Y1I6_ALISE|nr:5-dehydro-2-deoxygluconokinase [Alicyclobacillus sendaiensis]MDI9261219.1 5-dehydro-2-deoxygluconokinase [Alicyclobacillus sendaiensis PA2]